MTYEEQREAALRAKLGANYDKYMAKMAEEANSKEGQVQADKVAAEKPREPVTPSPQPAPKGSKPAEDSAQGADSSGGKPMSKVAKDDAVATPDQPAATQADDGPKQVPQKKSAPRTKGKKVDPASTPEERTGK